MIIKQRYDFIPTFPVLRAKKAEALHKKKRSGLHRIALHFGLRTVRRSTVSYLPFSKEWITTPERSFGSNHVVFGGMMLPVSAMSISCCIETG